MVLMSIVSSTRNSSETKKLKVKRSIMSLFHLHQPSILTIIIIIIIIRKWFHKALMALTRDQEKY